MQAALGADIEIDGIYEDEKVTVAIPEGCQNDQIVRVKGFGMPRLKSDARGDLFAHIAVEVPKKLSSASASFGGAGRGDGRGRERGEALALAEAPRHFRVGLLIMSLPRFFLENQVLAAKTEAVFPLRLALDDAKHARVLRLAAGEHIAVIDADQDYFECEIVDFADELPLVSIARHEDGARPARR
ncbi:MAG: DnaJ C-terminal domain-containing protein [Adlercreutzia equolifaciens]